MKALSYFGYICPKCKTTIDIGATIGYSDDVVCPQCGMLMIPNPDGKTCAANVHCPKCNSNYGLVNSSTCPNCGGPFSKID